MATTRTKKKRTTKKTRNDWSSPARHPSSEPRHQIKEEHPLMNCQGGACFVRAGVLLLTAAMTPAAQNPVPASSVTPAQETAAKPDKPSKKKYSHADDFLIRGTVFNEQALSFPGVELRFRKEGQKKYRWDTYTNSRGEFAVRVPQGSNYEVLVHVKGFADQMKTVEAKGGGNEESLVFRMEPVTGDAK